MAVDWQPISTAPDNQIVWTKIEDANGARSKQRLRRIGNLWLLPNRSMRVHYTPTHWAPLAALEQADAG